MTELETNPFVVKNRTSQDSRALCPWTEEDHDDFYAPVDHSQEAFEDYTTSVGSELTPLLEGRLILIKGEAGCGKTSLMHRCAHWTRQNGKGANGIHVVIADLTKDNLAGMSADARMNNIYSRIVDEIQFENFIDHARIDSLSAKRQDFAAGFPYLSRVLAGEEVLLLVLLPEIELSVDLTNLCHSTKRNIVFFTESSFPAVTGFTSFPTQIPPPILLEVGLLTRNDGWKFVESRLRLISPAAPLVTIPEEVVNKFMEVRIGGRGAMNVRELHLAMAEVYDQALVDKPDAISFDDFSQYYLRKGAI